MPTVKDVVVKKPGPQEADTCKKWGTWQSPVDEFPWDYTQTETCLILEGKVTVTDRPETDDSVTFGPGDMVIFPVGLKCIWKVHEPVKKHFNFS